MKKSIKDLHYLMPEINETVQKISNLNVERMRITEERHNLCLESAALKNSRIAAEKELKDLVLNSMQSGQWFDSSLFQFEDISSIDTRTGEGILGADAVSLVDYSNAANAFVDALDKVVQAKEQFFKDYVANPGKYARFSHLITLK
jgi:hypothetical protein